MTAPHLQCLIYLTELAERVGVTIANLSVLKTGKARAVRFSTLEAICAALECQPGDILEYTPNNPDGLPEIGETENHLRDTGGDV